MMKNNKILFRVLMVFILSTNIAAGQRFFDQQAHRGGRGLMPENTLSSMKNAIDYGSTLEMDIQMSKDRFAVVSHDAFFNSGFSLTPEGDSMTIDEGKSRLIYHMEYDSIAMYDVGSKPNSEFPDQKNFPEKKPLFAVLIDSVETYAKKKKHVNHYNIELKSRKEWDGKHYPTLEEYVDTVVAIVHRKGIERRSMIQSFDVRALRIVKEKWPEMKILYLTGKREESPKKLIEILGFLPDYISPDYRLVTKQLIDEYHRLGVKVIPGVANNIEDVQRQKDWGVDGIMTDYPTIFDQLN